MDHPRRTSGSLNRGSVVVAVVSDAVELARTLFRRYTGTRRENQIVAKDQTNWLDGVTFDTSAWGPTTEVEGLRCWKVGNATINERFFDMAPDIERLDLEYLYETMREEFGLVESQGWPVETLRNLVPHPTLPDELPSLNSLIDVEVASLQGVPTVAITSRQRFEGKIHFGTTLLIMFKTCFWTLRVEAEDPDPIGEREGAVFRAVLDESSEFDDPAEVVDPYERRWDGLIPLESDPLRRLRVLTGGIVSTIQFGPMVSHLDPFTVNE